MRQTVARTVLTVLVLLSTFGFAQSKKTPVKAGGGGPDKAHLQSIWDAWSTLDPANAAEFYAPGPHTFFDIAPLKYASWEEYQKGVVNVLADFKTAKLTVNDDARDSSRGPNCVGDGYREGRCNHEVGQARDGQLPVDGGF